MELPRTLRELLDAPHRCQVDKDRQCRRVAGNVSAARSGYRERMARPRRPESARVPIGLKVSDADAARINQVLARPEYAGWTRAEWCREIIRSALRYYVGDGPVPDPGQARVAVRPAAAEPVPLSQPPPRMAANSAAPSPTRRSRLTRPAASRCLPRRSHQIRQRARTQPTPGTMRPAPAPPAEPFSGTKPKARRGQRHG